MRVVAGMTRMLLREKKKKRQVVSTGGLQGWDG